MALICVTGYIIKLFYDLEVCMKTLKRKANQLIILPEAYLFVRKQATAQCVDIPTTKTRMSIQQNQRQNKKF